MNRTETILAIIFAGITLAQSLVNEWIRRRATKRAHGEIADRVVERMNGRNSDKGSS